MSLEDPAPAVQRLLDMLTSVSAEAVALSDSSGRILAQPVVSDRPSPASDVTAMDGYAVRVEDLPGELPVVDEAAIGQAPPELRSGTAIRIFTGAPIPPGADAVVKREDVVERASSIVVQSSAVTSGQHIRREGENLEAGVKVVGRGTAIDSAVAAALATFGVVEPVVHRRVRIGTVATGDEVLAPSAHPSPFQLRDSNTSALAALLGLLPWVEVVASERRVDNRELLGTTLSTMLGTCDTVFLTGGLSMGNYDFVPEVISDVGGEIIFHRLRQRPGKPLLGAVGPSGQAIIGLPGNPVSVMVTARRWGLSVLRRQAGLVTQESVPAVMVANDDGETIDLWWHRLVSLDGEGRATLVTTKGSGDLVSAARSDGFIALPPNAGGSGPWPFYAWGSA